MRYVSNVCLLWVWNWNFITGKMISYNYSSTLTKKTENPIMENVSTFYLHVWSEQTMHVSSRLVVVNPTPAVFTPAAIKAQSLWGADWIPPILYIRDIFNNWGPPVLIFFYTMWLLSAQTLPTGALDYSLSSLSTTYDCKHTSVYPIIILF